MSRDEILAKITEVIVDTLGTDASEVAMETRFREDLEADSLDLVELIMAFEEEFDGEIPDDAAQQLKTVGDAVKYVEEKM